MKTFKHNPNDTLSKALMKTITKAVLLSVGQVLLQRFIQRRLTK